MNIGIGDGLEARGGGFKLRTYQADGVERLRASMRSGRRSPLFVLPTGGGKTAVFSYIAEQVRARSKRVTILVHRFELLKQASTSLSRLGVSHGLVSPAFAQMPKEMVHVASVQTLVRRLDRTEPPDLIIIDEAHHSISPTYQKIFNAYPQALRLGVTATPVRTSGEGLDSVFDDMILGPSVSELIALGHLVTPEVYAPPIGVDLTGVHRRMGDYDKRELSERVDKPSITGCAVEHYLRLARGEPAIAFCVSVRHAEAVAADFRARGVRSVHVDGTTDDSARAAALEGLGNGTIDVVTSADLIGEGVDIPRCSVAILLRPTDSEGLYLQQVGRALRPFEGKRRALILDHVGNTMRHGFPDDDRVWSLKATRRGGGSRDLDLPSVRINQCEKCYFVFEIGPEVCPQCKRELPNKGRAMIQQSEGELKKLTREAIDAAKRDKRIEVGRAQTLEELVKIGRERKYQNPVFWAKKVLAGRGGKRA
jgi:DNA repair protein RadD